MVVTIDLPDLTNLPAGILALVIVLGLTLAARLVLARARWRRRPLDADTVHALLALVAVATGYVLGCVDGWLDPTPAFAIVKGLGVGCGGVVALMVGKRPARALLARFLGGATK